MHHRTGIVLSGGGARGAYEVGFIAGITEALDARQLDRAPFEVFAGTSVGAINCAWLASHADQADMEIDGLVDAWLGLDLRRHLRVDPLGLVPSTRLLKLVSRLRKDPVTRVGRSIIDPRAIEALVSETIPFPSLYRNVDRGIVRALIIASLNIEDGMTTMFAELAPGVHFQSSRGSHRTTRATRIDRRHVLASSAIPLIFPAREIDGRYYCDGGLRFNTPIAPAIRGGAERLVVVSLRSELRPTFAQRERALAAYPNPIFLVGKILDALLLDPVNYDLQVLDRFNRVLATLDEVLGYEEMERVQAVLRETRGAPYRRVERLVFSPSADIGVMAAQRAHELRHRNLLPRLVFDELTADPSFQADLLSFVLFDGEFARRLIALGRSDAMARAAEIRAFFDAPIRVSIPPPART